MFRVCLALFLLSSALGLEVVKPTKDSHFRGTKDTTHKDHLDKLKNYTYKDFVRQFQRQWTPGTEEFKQREAIFQANMNKIKEHHEGGPKAWNKGVNKFMDYTEAEFTKMLGHKGRRSRAASSLIQSNTTNPVIALPATHDWRSKLVQSSKFPRDQD